MKLAHDWGGSPLDVMEKEIDDVITFINYLLDYAEKHEQKGGAAKQKIKPQKDNFWDF